MGWGLGEGVCDTKQFLRAGATEKERERERGRGTSTLARTQHSPAGQGQRQMRSSAFWALHLRKAIGLAVMDKVKTGRLAVSVQRGCGVWRVVWGKQTFVLDRCGYRP